MIESDDQEPVILPAPIQLLSGDLSYYRQLFTPEQAYQIYRQLLQEIDWKQESVVVYGREHPSPRLQSWIGDEHLTYQYSGKIFQPALWTATTRYLLTILNTLLASDFNSVLANYYRNGEDSMGWHSDDEKELGQDPTIASLSFGIERDFSLRKRGENKQRLVLPLAPGSLLVMNPGMQSRWQHALPKRKRLTSGRINLTFRKLIV